MNVKIDSLRKIRESLLAVISDLTVEQLNKVPEGFNNNIIWNLGHLLSSQQGLCYLRSGRKMTIADHYLASYQPSTKPEGDVASEGIDEIKSLFLSVVDRFEADYDSHAFSNYIPYKNRYEIEITNIDDAMTFVLFHEGIHFGYIMALKRVLLKA